MSEVISVLKELIAAESVTPSEGGAFKIAQRVLAGFRAERIDKNGVSNILFTKDGSPPSICFAGHVDVVPPGEGWLGDPFEPIAADGKIFGRGAQDMKSGVAAILCACAKAKTKNKLSVLLTSDEEGEALYGTKAVLELLAKRGELPHFAIVAEPTCEAVFGDTIKIGRRGSVNGTLIVKGESGHAAYPEKCDNPIDKLARVLPRLSGAALDSGDEPFAASKIIFTDIRGGYEITNMTPGEVKLMFNVRNSPKTSEENIKIFIENEMSKALVNNYEMNLKTSSKPFITNSPKLVEKLSRAVEKHAGIKPKLSVGGGTSDARFFAEFGALAAEFGVRNDKIHMPNECVPIADVIALEKIFADFIADF